MDADGVEVLDTGAAANLVRPKWLDPHDEISGRLGVPRAVTYPACVRFKSGDSGLGEFRYDADIPVGIAGSRGRFTACVLEADILASFR